MHMVTLSRETFLDDRGGVGLFWECSKVTLGMFLEHSKHVMAFCLGTVWKQSANILGLF